MMGEGEEGMEGRKDERSEGGKGEGGKEEERKNLMVTARARVEAPRSMLDLSIQGGRCGEGGVRAMTDWNRLWKSRGSRQIPVTYSVLVFFSFCKENAKKLLIKC